MSIVKVEVNNYGAVFKVKRFKGGYGFDTDRACRNSWYAQNNLYKLRTGKKRNPVFAGNQISKVL